MRTFLYLTQFATLALLIAACSPAGFPQAEAAAEVSLKTCPVTAPPEPPFVPPAPFPAVPPNAGEFWYGTAALWTTLPEDGAWGQLARGEKFFWWSAEYDVKAELVPDLTITGRRLDAEAPSFETSEATNASHKSFGTAMLVGVELPTPGCWEITGTYRGERLSLVVLVPE
jgi:hypothetical protein